MADTSKIEWTDATWNPVTGCSKVSQGCKNCYAERVADRFFADQYPRVIVPTPADGCVPEGVTPPDNVTGHWTRPRRFTDVQCHPDRLAQPLRWRKPRRVFVNSMSDLFHEAVPDSFIDQVFAVMALAPHHTFQCLSKRPERMRDYVAGLSARSLGIAAAAVALWGARNPDQVHDGVERAIATGPLHNVWLGVSVEDQATADERIPHLLATPAAVRWVSLEPMLGAVDLRDITVDMQGGYWQIDSLFCEEPTEDCGPFGNATLDWIVLGGESGPGSRPMHPQWVRDIRDQCAAEGVGLFFKQWGEWMPSRAAHDAGFIPSEVRFPWGKCNPSMGRVGKAKAGHLLDGEEIRQWPKGVG